MIAVDQTMKKNSTSFLFLRNFLLNVLLFTLSLFFKVFFYLKKKNLCYFKFSNLSILFLGKFRIFPVLDFCPPPGPIWGPTTPLIFVPLSPSLAAALGPPAYRPNLTYWNKGVGEQKWWKGRPDILHCDMIEPKILFSGYGRKVLR